MFHCCCDVLKEIMLTFRTNNLCSTLAREAHSCGALKGPWEAKTMYYCSVSRHQASMQLNIVEHNNVLMEALDQDPS